MSVSARMMRRLVAAVVALTAIVAFGPSAGAGATFAVGVFARVPAPGRPWGIAVHDGRVVVSTAGGTVTHANTQGERIFTYGPTGTILHTFTADEGPVSYMGLGGMAYDASNRLYVADMNGLIRRYGPDGASQTLASAPLPYSAGSWTTSMWNDIDFDARGNAYITDAGLPAGGRIWRLTPEGVLSVWFSDPHFFFSGPFQAQVDATGRFLYFVVNVSGSPDGMFAGIVYRLPLKDQPQSSDLQEIHRFSVDESDLTGCLPSRVPTCGPATNGMALGESGRIYVAESGRNEIAVLSSDGVLLRTISNPLFDYPGYLAFRGDKLLVTNNDGFDPVDRPERWAVLSVDVGDTGVPPFQPTNIK